MFKIKNLPKPPTPIRKILEADVYKSHSDSSDDDLNMDQTFKETSFRITQNAIDNMSYDRVEELNK